MRVARRTSAPRSPTSDIAVQAEHAAGDEHGDARRVGERGRDQQAVRDDDELPLRAQLEREVVRGRARVERDRLAVARPSPRRPLAIARFRSTSRRSRKSKPSSDWPRCSGADAAAHAGDEPLPRELGEVAADGDLRNRKRFRKFRNVNGIARLEHAQDFLHPLVLRQIRHALGHTAPLAGAVLPRGTAWRPYDRLSELVNTFDSSCEAE